MHKEFGHIKSDPARTDHRNAFPNRGLVTQHVDISQYVLTILAGNSRITRCDTSGNHHLIKRVKVTRPNVAAQFHGDTRFNQHRAIPVHQPPEFFFPGDLLGHVQLAPNLVSTIKERHAMTALRR